MAYFRQLLTAIDTMRLDQLADIGARYGEARPVGPAFDAMDRWALALGAREAAWVAAAAKLPARAVIDMAGREVSRLKGSK